MTKFKAFLMIVLMLLISLSILFFNFSYRPNTKLQEQYWSAQDDAVSYQKKLWDQQKIIKYRLGIKFAGFSLDCDIDEIIDHSISVEQFKAQAIRGDCNGITQLSMERLFSEIEFMIIQKQCGKDGCECNGPYHMDVVYDERYHFPKSAKHIHHRNYRWMYKNTNIFGIAKVNLLYDDHPCLMYTDLEGFDWDVYKFAPLK